MSFSRAPTSRARVSNLKNPQRSVAAQEEQLAFLRSLNGSTQERHAENPFLDGLLEAHELAFRM